MDKYNLNMVTLSNHDLKEKIDSVADVERITTVYTAGDINKPDTYCKADVVFVSYSMATDCIQTILDNKAEYTKIVLLNDDSSNEFQKELLAFDLWNLNGIELLHHISNLKQEMLVKLDLELRENQLYTLMDSMPDLVWYKDVDGLHIDVNDAFCYAIGKQLKDIKTEVKYLHQGTIMGMTDEQWETSDLACKETDALVLKEQTTHTFDEQAYIAGNIRQAKVYKTALKGRNGESIGTVGIAHDVTDIWNTHEEFRLVISRLPFPMFILNKNYDLLSFNSKFEEIFHTTEENKEHFEISAFGQKFFNYDIAMCGAYNKSVERQMTIDNQTHYYVIEKSQITDVFGELSGYFYIFRDVTKTRKYEEKLRIMAETDELTQINNRKAISDFYETRIDSLVRKNLSFSVSIIDIDYFKLYNDHYGHLEGDMVIKSLANILKSHSDNEEVFVARFGGEEFLVITINKTPDEVKTLIEKLQQDLKNEKIPHEKSQVNDNVTMSIGVHYLQEVPIGTNLTEIIELADKNLYKAKEQGRNRCITNI